MSDTGLRGISAGHEGSAHADGTSRSHTPYSYLPWPSQAILQQLSLFQMLTASQLRRLNYQTGTPTGREVRSRRHLARLTKLGMVKRFWGVYRRPEYVYIPASSKARTPNMHTLDIAEIYTVLTRHSITPIQFDPEPWCHTATLKPDGYIKIANRRYYLEMDRGTEFSSVLKQKMSRYTSALKDWNSEESFPQVVWVVHDTNRKRFIENIIKPIRIPFDDGAVHGDELFKCALFQDACQLINPAR